MAKKTRVAINGFGRIGRLTLRTLLKDRSIDVVAVNDLTDNATLAHLFKYDTSQGTYDGKVSSDKKTITIGRKQLIATSIKDPAKLPWKANKIDLVLECTGVFREKDKAALHLKAGAKKVIISAPGKGGVKTIVMGVNDDEIKKTDKILSNASCTTNCLAPLLKVITDKWGLVQGSMTTIHGYTGDQRLQDAPHKDMRRCRAAAQNIIPTSTGAADAVTKVLDGIDGKLFAMALRVPVITGSLVELNVLVEKDITVEKVNAAFKTYSRGKLNGILQYVDDPIVSSDIIGNQHSSIFDSGLTKVSGKLLKVVSWYDNEAGFSARLAQLASEV